ncbi:gluconokinase [Marinomonas sp. C2222]|uniref:Gluconokinase n=1 Tax=Marinomonas sargassi TaxID=2984494 RepID=A0ABT2YP96_9GAMM|nr:gluconokinase [Marinomonas sargassi]MCV2401709.1 gluconokinase [Marinomonas sargassi]
MNKKIVVLGVSGSGKSLIGQKIAQVLGYVFLDGDDFHSEANVSKMRQGIPLNDEDRSDWLITLNQELQNHDRVVLACSALKPQYRAQLRNNLDDISMLYLKGDFDTIWQRHQQRENHYFNGKDMLESQFATLVEPSEQEAHHIDIKKPVNEVLKQALATLIKTK